MAETANQVRWALAEAQHSKDVYTRTDVHVGAGADGRDDTGAVGICVETEGWHGKKASRHFNFWYHSEVSDEYDTNK